MSYEELLPVVQTWAPRILAASVAFAAARWYFNGGYFREKVRADGKVAIVTGANTGLGKETARQLANRGAKVYLFCRSKERTEAAIKDLIQDGCPANKLIFLRLDLADLESVRKCAQEFLAREPRLDILINNAALSQPEFELTKDGHEKVWQSNYLGHFLLTELLLSALQKSTDGRVVHVSARLHTQIDKLDLDTLDDKRSFKNFLWSYSRSKLAQILSARELAKRLAAKGITNVTVNSLHPGVIQTELQRNASWWMKIILLGLRPVRLITSKTPEYGVQTTLLLALSQKLNGATGKYYRDCAEDSISKLAQDDRLAKDLYDLSAKQVGI